MKKPNYVRFVLSAKKIVSVNALYGAKLSYTGRGPVASMYKKSDAKKMEEYIKEQVRILDLPNNHPWINKKTLFKLNFTIIFKNGFLLRDLDNCCKNLIDGLFRAMGLNDSHIVEIHCEKTLCPDFTDEKILVELSEYTGEPRFDKLTEELPIPTKIFLGGTCPEWNGKQWRDELIPELEKRSIEYFNPVVKDWTPECREIENTEKNEHCDSHLYILTPALSGIYSIAEIVNSVWEVREYNYGSCFLGILGSKDDWGEGQWRSISALVELVNSLGKKSPKISAKFINSPVEILEGYGKPKRKRTR